MRHTAGTGMLAAGLLSMAILAGCSDEAGSAERLVEARDPLLVPQAGDSIHEPTPAERRLEWVRGPAKSTKTAALDSRISAEGAKTKSRTE